jgi:hypothetical protein
MELKDGRRFTDRLVTYASAPGYRDIALTVALNDGTGEREVTLRLSAKDALLVMEHIRDVNRCAWTLDRPIDATPAEQRPAWL